MAVSGLPVFSRGGMIVELSTALIPCSARPAMLGDVAPEASNTAGIMGDWRAASAMGVRREDSGCGSDVYDQ